MVVKKNAKKSDKEQLVEEFKVSGEELVKKVKELIKKGNARRIIIKNEKGKVLIEMPLTAGVTVGAIGTLIAPVLAAVGAIAALVAKVTVVVERR